MCVCSVADSCSQRQRRRAGAVPRRTYELVACAWRRAILFKSAYITPLSKKADLDPADAEVVPTDLELSVLSKRLEVSSRDKFLII